MIRPFQESDIQALTDIYNYYVLHTIVTFDFEPYTVEGYLAKITRIQKDFPCFVFEQDGEVIGFSYASKWRQKPAYNQTVESTVYLHPERKKGGIGSKLYKALLDELKQQEYQVVLGGISLPNDESVAFHEKFGFKKVGHFDGVGRKFYKWIAVGFWQLNLDDWKDS